MSHPEQLGFFRAVADVNRPVLAGRVLEVGSYDFNGSVRQICSEASSYTGVDLQPGPGVDVVGFGHELSYSDSSFDAALSSECFEHDPHWASTFANMCRMTRPGGLVAFTCAAAGRPEHGTRRTDRAESPGTQAVGLDYYRNLMVADLREAVPLEKLFVTWRAWYLPQPFDLYFAGVRRGDAVGTPTASLPNPDQVDALGQLMSLPHRLVRLPLRPLLRLAPEPRYQQLALPYWRGALATQALLSRNRFLRSPVRIAEDRR